MIQLATALPAITVGPVKPNAAISVDVSGFALALGALMPKIAAPGAAPQGNAGDAAVPLPEGQELAETGKELPDAVVGLDGKSEDQLDSDSDSEEDASAEEAPPPPFAWFAVTQQPTPQPEAKAETAPGVTVETGGKRARRDVQLPEASAVDKEAAPATTDAIAKAATQPIPQPQPQTDSKRAAPVQRQPRTDAATAVPVDPAEDAAIAQAMQAEVTTTEGAEQPVTQAPVAQAPRELRKAAADAPVIRIALDTPAAPQKTSIADVTQGQRQPDPASQSVAEQIFAAFDSPAPRTAANPARDPQVDLSTLTAQTTGTQTAAAVTAAGGAGQDATLDTSHQQWTAKMIDKIEAMQGGSPVRETKVSLMPEGLGKVDIAIRQDDAGSLHVQFSTDTQSARQLIADAQPKLAEIAQERGIRLGSTSVESNAAGNGGTGAGSNANSQMNQGQQNDARPQRNQPSAAPSAHREAQSSTHDDERVA